MTTKIKALAFQFGPASFLIMTLNDENEMSLTARVNCEVQLNATHFKAMRGAFNYLNAEFGCCGLQFDSNVTDGLLACSLQLSDFS